MNTDDLFIDEPVYDPETSEWTARLIVRDTGKAAAETEPRKTRKAAMHSAKALLESLLRKHEAAKAGGSR